MTSKSQQTAEGAEAVLDRVERLAQDSDTASIGEIRDALGHLGTAPLLLVPALIGASPLGGIPVLPTIMALCVALVAVQLVAGRRAVWLPERLKRQSVRGDRLDAALGKVQPLARWADRLSRERLTWLEGGMAVRVAALCCLGLALIVPPLELVPFAAALPFATIVLFALAMLLRDGLVMLLAFAATAAAVYFVPGWLAGG